MKNKVELLAPAGDFETFKVAIDAGCDAIYCSGKEYGARAYAKNFDDEELASAIDYAHLYGVKVYVTVNTIVLEKEIDSVIKYLDYLYLHNCDAFIVQDLGLASIIKTRYPNISLHASTQINAQTVEDVKVLKKIGFDRVILGREVSLQVIKEIKKSIDIELEVFIHGALCISYSGGCYFSSMAGNRSGNRGKCSQPCRKEYTSNAKKKFFLSTKDLCTIDNILEISKYCDSLKIEGRMKSKEYVYNVVTSYRDVLENGYVGLDSKKYSMQMAFNRGYTKGFINDEKNELITNIDSSNHQGVIVGEVVKSVGEKTSIKLVNNLQIDDCIRIVGKNNEDAVICNAMYCQGNLVKKGTSNDIINLKTHKEMSVGDKVYITKRNYDFNDPKYIKRKVDLKASVKIVTHNLELTISDGKNNVIGVIPFENTEKDNSIRLKEQIGKTGGTIYKFTEIDCNVPGVYVPISEINNLRRNLLEQLSKKRIERSTRHICDKEPEYNVRPVKTTYKTNSIAIENIARLESLSNFNDFDIYLKEENIESSNNKYYYYLPRVTDKTYQNSPTVFTNLGNLSKVSSVYLNVCNSYTVRLLESLGVEKIGLSIELSKNDIAMLIESFYNRYQIYPRLEVMVYGYYQLMYMKHCFINKERHCEKLNCGNCKKDYLFDNLYPVYGDTECHLAILSKDIVDLRSKIEELKEIGVKHFLFDLTKIKEYNEKSDEDCDKGYFGHYIKEIE